MSSASIENSVNNEEAPLVKTEASTELTAAEGSNINTTDDQSELSRIRNICTDLQDKIVAVENKNSLLSLAIARSSLTATRLRTEYSVLLEALERKANAASETTVKNDNMNEVELSLEDVNALLDNSLSRLGSRQGNGIGAGGKRSSSQAAQGKRGPKKIKDPNFPKRPTNAYLLFCEGEKDRIKTLPQEEQAAIGDLSKHLTECWKALDDEARKPFYKMYEADKERFSKELVEYEKKKQLEMLGEDASSASTPAALSDTAGAPLEDDAEDIDDDRQAKRLKIEEDVEESQAASTLLAPAHAQGAADLDTDTASHDNIAATASPTPAVGTEDVDEDDNTSIAVEGEDEEDDEEDEEEKEEEEEENRDDVDVDDEAADDDDGDLDMEEAENDAAPEEEDGEDGEDDQEGEDEDDDDEEEDDDDDEDEADEDIEMPSSPALPPSSSGIPASDSAPPSDIKDN